MVVYMDCTSSVDDVSLSIVLVVLGLIYTCFIGRRVMFMHKNIPIVLNHIIHISLKHHATL